MEQNTVGYRFHPTDEELINHYLKNKILGNSSLVDEVIREININDYDPVSLRFLAKIKSNDPTWYFFAPTLFMSSKRIMRKRCTKSGFWKPTGKDREIKDRNGKKIGLKKTLVYYQRGASKIVKMTTKKKKKNPWVMHEYHIKSWSHPEMESYVICKIKYKGEEDGDGDIVPSVGETSQSLVSDSVINTQLEVEQPCEENGLSLEDLDLPIMNQPVEEFDQNTLFDGLSENDFAMPIMNEQNEALGSNTFFDGLSEIDLVMPIMNEPELPPLPQALYVAQNVDLAWDYPLDTNTWLNDQEKLVMEEYYNDYKPRKPLAGIIVGYDSDNDSEEAESISVTSYQGTMSPGDSAGSSSNIHFPSCRDEETLSSSEVLLTSSADSSISSENTESQLTRRMVPSKQEVKEDLVKTEKEGLIVTDYTMAKTLKNQQYVYVMKMIIGLILSVAFIGTIVSVLSTVED